MLFFSQAISQFIQLYDAIFASDDDVDEDEDDLEEDLEETDGLGKRDDGEVGSGNNNDEGNGAYSWLSLLKEVSDLTHDPWSSCWAMPIYEFFGYVAFNREYNRRQEEYMRNYKAQHGLK